ncbi:MAG: sensor domain-containing diguanylate cyclase, partial [Thermotogaceae bacterium]|nr:sensor domain-containing diguanylate cyclase [Thermotogaceae bacterium]
EERRRILYSSGRVGEIKVTLSIPIVVFDEIVAYFNLDNFEQTDAFDEDSVEIAEIFAKLTGVLFQRFHFEEELKKQKELAEYQSFHDSLTGLPNRRMLLEESEKILALAKRKQKPVTMMYLDLYKFKEINDSFGHNTGDEVLKVVANRLKKPLRRSDLVGRIGGDEFITVLPETSADQAKALALRLIEVIEEPIEVGNRTFNISVNIGISQYPENGDSFGKLIHAADVALYKAKKEKKAYCIFERP